jgi:hypothetical protein
MTPPGILPSPLWDKVGCSNHDRFRGYFPVHFIPAYNLPVYASQWTLPDATQDSVHGCWLSFAAAAIPGDWVTCAFKAQPSQTRTCRIPASGSSRASFAHGGVTITPSVTRLSSKALASAAIRCRFVDRFAKLKVFSRVSRQRLSSRGASLPSVGSRRVQFPACGWYYEGATTSYSRIPGHLFGSLPVPRDPSAFVFALRRSRADGGPASSQDHCPAGDPTAGVLSRGREWDLSGSQAVRPVPLPRSMTPAESTLPRH